MNGICFPMDARPPSTGDAISHDLLSGGGRKLKSDVANVGMWPHKLQNGKKCGYLFSKALPQRHTSSWTGDKLKKAGLCNPRCNPQHSSDEAGGPATNQTMALDERLTVGKMWNPNKDGVAYPACGQYMGAIQLLHRNNWNTQILRCL